MFSTEEFIVSGKGDGKPVRRVMALQQEKNISTLDSVLLQPTVTATKRIFHRQKR